MESRSGILKSTLWGDVKNSQNVCQNSRFASTGGYPFLKKPSMGTMTVLKDP